MIPVGASRTAAPVQVHNTLLKELVAAAALSCVAILFGQRIIEHPLYAVAFLSMGALVWLIAFHPKLAVHAALAGVVLIEEFELSSTEAFFESGISKSVLSLRIAGVSFPDVLTLLFLVPVLIRVWYEWKNDIRAIGRPLDKLFIPIIIVYAFGATQGLFHYLTFSHYTWEARDIVYILAWYFVVSRTFNHRTDAVTVMGVILVTFSLKSLLFAYRAVAGEGLFYGFDFYRRALGSDVPMIAVPVVTLIAAAVLYQDAPRWFRFSIVGLIVYWSIWFIGSLGRATYLATAVALVVSFIVMRRQLRLSHILLPLAAAVIGGSLYYWLILTEANRALVSTMIGTSVNWVDAILLYEDKSMGQRVMEIMNIGETLSRAGAWLWGLGWGAPWEELVVHHPIDVASFEHMEAVSGVHTAAHIDAMYYVLKVGILGTLILYASYARFVFVGIRLFRKEDDRAIRVSIMAMLAMMIIFLPNFVYFLKLKICLGAVFGCLCILAQSADVYRPDPVNGAIR